MRNKRDLKIRNEKIILVILTVAVVIWTIININSIFKVMENVKKLEASKNENVVNTVIQENIVTAEEIEENTNQLEIEDLKDKDERTRIQQYCGKLYPEFKNNYFKTLEDFTNYVQAKFPSSLITVEYDNIERQGKYYILFTTVKTPLDSNYSMDQKFILIENGFNDFQLSFDVKQ